MKLRFYGRNAHTVYWPGTYAPGQPRPQIGKTFVPAEGRSKPAHYLLDKEPAEVDEATQPEAAAHFIRQCQKGGLWAADAMTAARCNLDFVKVEMGADGDYAPVAHRSAASTTKPKAEAS